VGLDSVEIVWAAEDTFGISISNEEAAGMRTVGDLGRCIAQKVAERASVPGRPVLPELDLIWPRLVDLVVVEFGVPRERVTPETEWVRDLGAS
jgi:acyl carrier protein